MKSFTFDDTTIQQIFGHEAAEDEDRTRLGQYYFKSSTFERMAADLPLRILVGHKGIGKSALITVSMAEDRQAGILAVLIRPDDVHEVSTNPSDLLLSIRNWKDGLERIICNKCLAAFDMISTVAVGRGVKFLDYIASTFKPLIDQSASLDETKRKLMNSFLKTRKIRVYLDDLDRGWTANKESILRLSALLNALRDLASEHNGIQFRVALRSDVYYLVRTSDESTDKIEGSVVWHSWTNHEILAMLAKRIEAFFGRSRADAELIQMKQSILAGFLESVMDGRFNGRGKWSDIPVHRMLMSVIRRRPRDLVKLCTLAAQNTAEDNRNKISSSDFHSIFETYSQGRLQDTINEFRSELPTIESLLLNMRPSGKRRGEKTSYIYSTSSLLEKIAQIRSSNEKFLFYGGKLATDKDLASLLYKINFLTARKDQGDFTLRRYFEDQKYLSASFVDFGFDWEVHPAYRWALQPEAPKSIWEAMNPSSDEE